MHRRAYSLDREALVRKKGIGMPTGPVHILMHYVAYVSIVHCILFL